jgi:hypothetical protein
MRPTRIELATSGLKGRRSLEPVKVPFTTELRAPVPHFIGLVEWTSLPNRLFGKPRLDVKIEA